MRRPKLIDHMMSWLVELSEFNLKYEPKGTMKGQRLIDFLVEM